MTTPEWVTNPNGLTEQVAAVWRRYAPEAYRGGFLRAETVERFRGMVRLIAVAEAAERELAKGVSIKTKSGVLREHPAVRVLINAQRELRGYLSDYGLEDIMSSPIISRALALKTRDDGNAGGSGYPGPAEPDCPPAASAAPRRGYEVPD